ncbi:glutamate receptor ionotropic, kainate glr-3-like [Hylaeus volcanicus]|uniref:glutamate receptor ionotropic, kainate glr-3-like n=1 Tax=Hylaeus volcanicus TaxID=313075 RepID=UPI0023B87B6B|nr:glutamate receptor ionotropic, kainate glr-3-like [Hylaeus volcanicus]XP_053985414.1 glutamate receptor ionotropic, kainate glr-3-like [Hylaeus volcanicus]XP_053985415.1 glutamate receptor ionotropic, kainate glr-3-like [Hylaeus volcanicus]
MGLLQRNEAHIILRTGYYTGRASLLDYTTPVSYTQYQLYIKPEYKHSNTWIIMVFERRIWYILLFMFLVLSLAGYVLQNKQHRNSRKKKRKQEREHFTFIDHVFYTYSIMCSQGHIPNSYHSQIKILSLSKSVFAWLILLSFSSDLIYQMTNRVMTLPFKNFDTLLKKTNYDVLVFKGSMIYEFVKAGVERSLKLSKHYDATKRIHFIEDSSMMHKTVCHSKKKYAMLETEDKVYMKNRHACHVIPVGDNYFQTWTGFALPKRFPYKKVINVSILKLHEFGLIDVLKDRWFKHRIKYEQKKTFKTIDMEQVYLILCIPFVGIALSLVVLFFEKAISFCENNSKRLT